MIGRRKKKKKNIQTCSIGDLISALNEYKEKVSGKRLKERERR